MIPVEDMAISEAPAPQAAVLISLLPYVGVPKVVEDLEAHVHALLLSTAARASFSDIPS